MAPEHQRVRRRRRIPSGFTYISGCVKYTMFFFNFIFWLLGLLLMGVSFKFILVCISNNLFSFLRLVYMPSLTNGPVEKHSN